jgi:hypothetical protein
MLARQPDGLAPDAVIENMIEAVGWVLHRLGERTGRR